MGKTCLNTGDILNFLKTISDENRLKILCFLKKGEQCVCDIVEFLNLPQNLISHHLKKLRDANLVSTRKEGLRVVYFLKDDEIKIYLQKFNNLFN